KPDSPDHRSAQMRAPPLKAFRSRESSAREHASEPPSRVIVTVRPCVAVVIGIRIAPGIASRRRRLTLLIADKTAIAAPCAKVAASDTEGKLRCRDCD